MPFDVKVRIQGIIGFRRKVDDEGVETLGVGIPDTLEEETLAGHKLRPHQPMLVFSWKWDAKHEVCVPAGHLPLSRGTKLFASVGCPVGRTPPVPKSGAPKMRDILKKEPGDACPWEGKRLLIDEFDLPPGVLQGWPTDGSTFGSMDDVRGNPLVDLSLGAEWTMGVADRSSFDLVVADSSREIRVRITGESTLWLINHPVSHVSHVSMRANSTEDDFRWYYWMLKNKPSSYPVPAAPAKTKTVPHIGACPPPFMGIEGQLCRPCEFCPCEPDD